MAPRVTAIQEIIAVGHFAATETDVADDSKLTFLKMAAIRWQEYEELHGGRAPDPPITEGFIQEQFNTAFATSSAREFIARLEGGAWEQKSIFDNLRERLGNVSNDIKIHFGLPWIRGENEIAFDELHERASIWEVDEWDLPN